MKCRGVAKGGFGGALPSPLPNNLVDPEVANSELEKYELGKLSPE